MNKRKVGENWEKEACQYLINKGYEIITCNYRCKIGEIDIIAKDGEYLVFVEVKYRSGNSYGYAIEAVNPTKCKKIKNVATYYLTVEKKNINTPCRFDVIGFDVKKGAFTKDVKITHIINAF